MADLLIRALKQKDRVTLAAMIRKMVEKAGNSDLLNIIVPDDKASAADDKTRQDLFSRVGVNILKMMLETIESDVTAWFRDLIGGKTEEEYSDLPFDIEIRIIEQIVASPEANNFFSGALRLSRKMQGLAEQYQKEKTR